MYIIISQTVGFSKYLSMTEMIRLDQEQHIIRSISFVLVSLYYIGNYVNDDNFGKICGAIGNLSDITPILVDVFFT